MSTTSEGLSEETQNASPPAPGADDVESPAINADADTATAATQTAADTKEPRKRAPRRANTKKTPARRRSSAPKKKGQSVSRGGTRPFPASSFEDALVLPDAIQRFGSGQRIRRLTLFDELGRSPDSSASRDLIYASSKYRMTKGSHTSEWLELTDEGNAATSPESSDRERARARYMLSIDQFPPFKALYDRYVGNKLPAASVMRDHVADAVGLAAEVASEAVETFVVNAKFVGILKPVAGVERLLSLDHALDELPSRTEPSLAPAFDGTVRRAANGRPATTNVDWEHTCFYITPIGPEDGDQRRHADVFLSSIVEPAMESLERGLKVVRADHIEHPGLITAQVIEHVFRSAVVVADLSFHNPNVFYELALRHASGKPTVLISRTADQIPFDVADVRTVQLDTTDIWSFVPQMETWRTEIARQSRRALDDSDGGGNPLTIFFPDYRTFLR